MIVLTRDTFESEREGGLTTDVNWGPLGNRAACQQYLPNGELIWYPGDYVEESKNFTDFASFNQTASLSLWAHSTNIY